MKYVSYFCIVLSTSYTRCSINVNGLWLYYVGSRLGFDSRFRFWTNWVRLPPGSDLLLHWFQFCRNYVIVRLTTCLEKLGKSGIWQLSWKYREIDQKLLFQWMIINVQKFTSLFVRLSLKPWLHMKFKKKLQKQCKILVSYFICNHVWNWSKKVLIVKNFTGLS